MEDRLKKDIFKVAGKSLKSRLIVGTGKYKNFSETAKAVKSSGADMVTVAVRRVNILDKKKPILTDYLNPKKRVPSQHIWLRARGKVDEAVDQNHGIHEAILSYASDFNLMSTALLPHEKSVFDQNLQPASLDHAIWFHDELRVDNWLLYSLDSPYAGNSRGFNRGTFFTEDGRLVASTVQEGLMRIHPKKQKIS